ncbi:hypothetical protein [Candidatus Poriferisodalis sp.]|uniref:hypothetical protein n=1 Tax=Candidatus Poriferisodalis sp. TaxID=3101277 RepID=UPI003B017480
MQAGGHSSRNGHAPLCAFDGLGGDSVRYAFGLARVYWVWVGSDFVELERNDTEVRWEMRDAAGTAVGIVTANAWTADAWVVIGMSSCFVDPSITHPGIAPR